MTNISNYVIICSDSKNINLLDSTANKIKVFGPFSSVEIAEDWFSNECDLKFHNIINVNISNSYLYDM